LAHMCLGADDLGASAFAATADVDAASPEAGLAVDDVSVLPSQPASATHAATDRRKSRMFVLLGWGLVDLEKVQVQDRPDGDRDRGQAELALERRELRDRQVELLGRGGRLDERLEDADAAQQAEPQQEQRI